MTRIPLDQWLKTYQSESGAYDEMWLNKHEAQPHWHPFIQALSEIGSDELDRMQQEASRQLRENGVTYNVHGDPANLHRPWALDIIPFIISQPDWQNIETGLRQRAELLNLILADIYGPRTLIKNGLIPPELIYGHQGFLRPCDGISSPDKHHLIVYGADLARGPNGQMWVLADHTQAPSGAGYALENRTVSARLMGGLIRDHKVLRLANFFRDWQLALADLAATRTASPRVVVLSPGTFNETYFEHAYLAAYLGFSLVQGDDLTVHNGQLSLKSLQGLQPVDVILRRVDDLFCDPLELRDDSRLGVAGLLEATRRQNVVIANPLGSGILENPGLMPFMPGLSKHLLGEDLHLPSAATWWCGHSTELSYVLDNLSNLLIKTLHRHAKSRTVHGFQLDKEQLATLRLQIMAEPHLYVGQEQVSFSTTPSLVDGKLEPRHAVVRCFSVASQGAYVVMPGGLTRSAPIKGEYIVSNYAGGISKDTWVLTDNPQQHMSMWLQTNRIEQAFVSSYHLPSRAAESLFWVGRYAERAEAMARLLRVILDYINSGENWYSSEETTTAATPILLRALTHITSTYPGFVGKGSQKRLAQPLNTLLALTFNGNKDGGLRFNVNALMAASYAVRDLWSSDTWRVIEGFDSHLQQSDGGHRLGLQTIQNQLNHLITNLMAFAGLNSESMTHEAGWLLLDIGRRLERSLLTTSLIRAIFGAKHNEAVEHLLLDATLRTTENVITYRRRYRSHLQLQTMLDLLLLDTSNPRSLIYQLNQLQGHIGQLPRTLATYRLSQEERLVLDASTRLRLINTETIIQTTEFQHTRQALDDFLSDISTLLSQLAPVLTEFYFTHVQVPYQRLTIASLSDEPTINDLNQDQVA